MSVIFIKLLALYQILIPDLIGAKQYTSGPRVCTTTCGCFNGTYLEGYRSEKFAAFLGIPYAQKPRRFEPPILYNEAKEHNATTVQYDCLQKNYLIPNHLVSGSEDCLYLNIYKRMETDEVLLPVMVYIFGGGFFSGTVNPLIVGPAYLMDTSKVVVVTLNYRLGAFGFLATNDSVIPGNIGLKDQLCALQWVQENIEFFGGDKFKVTIFGQSAGAVSVHMHVLSPVSNSFYAAISMSGTANVPFAIDENPEETARLTAKYCDIKNWDTISTEELLAELRKVDAMKLIDAGDHLKYWDVDNMVNYKPIVEKPSATAFLSKHPVDILRTGDYNPVPMMFGRVPGEGGVRVVAIMESDKLRNEFNKDFYNLMVKFLEFPKKFTPNQIKDKMEKIIKEYFNGESELNNNTRKGFMDLVTDRGFYHPLFNTIKMYVNTMDCKKFPLFMYKFNYQGPYTFATLYAGGPTNSDYGVVHCDDLIYTLRASYIFPDFDKHSKPAEVITAFIDDFEYFAYNRTPKHSKDMIPCNKKTFNPKPGVLCDYKEYSKSNDDSLKIRIDNKFDTQRMEFWDSILEL